MGTCENGPRGISDPKATAPGQPGDLMFYEKAAGAQASGSLIGPWQGIHGWYWQNKSGAPVTVRLRLAGFYELIAGQAGQPVEE